MVENQGFMQKYFTDNLPNVSDVTRYLTPINVFGYFTNKKSENESSNNGFVKDPLVLVGALISIVIAYFYFANDFMCKMIGLFYPCYIMQKNLDNSEENSSMLDNFKKYFITYAHFEFVLMMTGLFGMHFYHVKILALLFLIYIFQYQSGLLEKIFQQIIFYDNVIFLMTKQGMKFIGAEFILARDRIQKKTE